MSTSETDQESSYEPGAVVGGRYRLNSLLGEGGMGLVFEAVDQRLERSVAIKLIRQSAYVETDADELIDRLEREARATARLGHPNIVPLLDFGHSPGEPPFMVMQLLEGQPLNEIIDTDPLDVERAVELHVQVLDALSAAHESGVVHRDLKPANIFVTRLGSGRELVRLLDFGVAYLLEDSAKKLTKQGISLGTPAYMSPERVLGDPTDLRADLYAVGVTLFQSLTGTLPFLADQMTILQGQILVMDAPDVRTRREDVPAPIAELIDRALKKKPDERFASAAEMRDLLMDAMAAAKAAPPLTAKALSPEALSPEAPAAVEEEGASAEPPPKITAGRSGRTGEAKLRDKSRLGAAAKAGIASKLGGASKRVTASRAAAGLGFSGKSKSSGAASKGAAESSGAASKGAAESPAAGSPAAGSPAAGSPAAGSPAAGSPAAGSPAAGSPAAESPAAESPAAESPAAEVEAKATVNLRLAKAPREEPSPADAKATVNLRPAKAPREEPKEKPGRPNADPSPDRRPAGPGKARISLSGGAPVAPLVPGTVEPTPTPTNSFLRPFLIAVALSILVGGLLLIGAIALFEA